MRIDEDFMNELGLSGMPEADKKNFMEQAEVELEMRVGHTIGMDLSDEQMDEFDQITDPDDASAWLKKNVPSFRETVQQVFQNFKAELKRELAQFFGLA